MPFDNRWSQHTYTSLTLLPIGLWAPGLATGISDFLIEFRNGISGPGYED